MAVYRTGFVLSGFFFFMALVTIGLKKSGKCVYQLFSCDAVPIAIVYRQRLMYNK